MNGGCRMEDGARVWIQMGKRDRSEFDFRKPAVDILVSTSYASRTLLTLALPLIIFLAVVNLQRLLNLLIRPAEIRI